MIIEIIVWAVIFVVAISLVVIGTQSTEVRYLRISNDGRTCVIKCGDRILYGEGCDRSWAFRDSVTGSWIDQSSRLGNAASQAVWLKQNKRKFEELTE